MRGTTAAERVTGRLRLALGVGAGLWSLLLVAGLVTGYLGLGGWVWGMPGPFGHTQNYVILLWLVSLVLAPLLAWRRPLESAAALQVYLLAILAVVLSTFRGSPLEFKAPVDVPPLASAAISIALLLWAHPDRSRLWRA
jgi:hypothetical protein